MEEGISATGLTFSELPMTMSRSQTSLSFAIIWWKSSGRLSPKKTISGLMTLAGLGRKSKNEDDDDGFGGISAVAPSDERLVEDVVEEALGAEFTPSEADLSSMLFVSPTEELSVAFGQFSFSDNDGDDADVDD